MPAFGRARSFDEMVARFGARYKWLALLSVGLGVVAAVLSTTSFNVAIPALTRHFGLGQERVQWAITGYMGAMTVAMLPTPWLLDRFGFRRCFLGAVLVLTATSIAGSQASQFAMVVAIRIVQGAAAGILQPLGTLAVMRLFPVESQGRASGVLGFGIVLAPAVAPTLGGLLLDHFGWQSIFLINLPFCLLAIGVGLYLLPAPREIKIRHFDWFGVGVLALGTLSMIEGVSSLQHAGPFAPWTLAHWGLALLSIAVFVWHGRRAAAPIVSLGLFRDRAFAMGTLVFLAYGFGLYASTYIIPVFLQSALGFSATSAGLALLPSGIALAVSIPIAGRLTDRHSPRGVTLAGLALFGISFLLFAFFSSHITYAEIIANTVIGRIGLALILPALSLAALRGMAMEQLGQASMVTSYVRQLGGVLGVAISAVFLEWRESVHGATAPGIFTAFAESFLMLAAAFALALVAAWRMKHRG
ncbi:MAG TPA: DHA2 family efflux MFS transporter permease subunit [Rhodocyclaceae bacterium]|nr:DHA2 family efflux MFS transporter permease subunit [Rhodocyclaceae bacterium]